MSVQELRARTGSGIVACASALKEANGDLDAAVLILRKKGLAKADGYSGRTASSGVVGSYIHHDKSNGVLITLSCETDFVARTPEFQELANNIAMHVMAGNPSWISQDEIPVAIRSMEEAVALGDLQKRGMEGDKLKMALKGKVDKVLSVKCLLDQVFVVDNTMTVNDAVKAFSAKCGEKVEIKAMTKMGIGS